MTSNLSDTSTWLPLDGLEPGFDGNKPPTTDALDGRTITLENDNGSVIEHVFTGTQVAWTYDAAPDDPHGDAQSADTCEVFTIDEDLYYVQFHTSSRPDDAVSLLLDLRSGRALSIVSLIGESGTPRVQQLFTTGTIRGIETTGEAPAPTTDLIGRRVMWTYSETHAYEHIYLSPHWYTWQCLAGPERGLADTDEHSTWRLRPGIYAFTWREKVIPCASVTIADHRNVRSIRSTGVLFGLAEDGASRTHFTFGADGRLVSTTVHPDAYDPATITA